MLLVSVDDFTLVTMATNVTMKTFLGLLVGFLTVLLGSKRIEATPIEDESAILKHVVDSLNERVRVAFEVSVCASEYVRAVQSV